MQKRNLFFDCWCTCELQNSNPHGVAGKTWPISNERNALHCSINFRVTRFLLNTQELSLYNLSFPKPHTCYICASCFYILHQDTNFCSGIPDMAWHRSQESICFLLWCTVGLGKHAQSQNKRKWTKDPVNFRIAGNAQHSGDCHSKTTNVLCVWCFVLCTFWLGHMISVEIQLWCGVEVRSSTLPCRTLRLPIQRCMSSAQHSGSLSKIQFCKFTTVVVSVVHVLHRYA